MRKRISDLNATDSLDEADLLAVEKMDGATPTLKKVEVRLLLYALTALLESGPPILADDNNFYLLKIVVVPGTDGPVPTLSIVPA